MPYQINNRSDDQNVDLHLLRRWVSQELGWSQDPNLLDDTQIQTVDDTINAGYRNYCYPPTLPQPFSYQPDEGHEWSFLRPVLSVLTQDSRFEYSLPPDFEHMIGPMVYSAQNSNVESYLPLEHTAVSRILYLLGVNDDSTAPPILYAVKQVENTGDTPQERSIILYPMPDGEYKLQGQYQATVRLLTETNPFPMGGQSHGPGILAACLAQAESRVSGGQGSRYKEFLAQVASGIQRDYSRLPEFIGDMTNDSYIYHSRSAMRNAGLLYTRPTQYVSS